MRLETIAKFAQGEINVAQAARVLGLSTRQCLRLRQQYLKGSTGWLKHGNTGRLPVNTIPLTTKESVVLLATTKYQGLNTTCLQQELRLKEGIALSVSTVNVSFEPPVFCCRKRSRRIKTLVEPHSQTNAYFLSLW